MRLLLSVKAGEARAMTRVIEGPVVIQPEAFYMAYDGEGPRSWLVEPEVGGRSVVVCGPDAVPLGRLGVGGSLRVGEFEVSLQTVGDERGETERIVVMARSTPLALLLPDGREHLLGTSAVTLGTHRECDIVLEDRAISARHCELACEDGRWWVSDLHSTNGTWVGGARVTRAELRPGTALTLGRSQLMLRATERVVPKSRTTLVGQSPMMQSLRREIAVCAGSPYPVLIQGPSGAGKELVASEIHVQSRVKDGPFVAINCAAISRDTIESELFGHERGAFTGADRRRRGIFEEAHGGTLFLDEIGDLPLAAQARLLRVLETGKVRRVGGEQEITVKVRVVAATWQDLDAKVRDGSFRLDLYYRLKGYELTVPALRDRRADVPILVEALLARIATETGRVHAIEDLALGLLIGHRWEGNVRELLFVLRRASMLCDGPMLFCHHIQAAGVTRPAVPYASVARGGGPKVLHDSQGRAERAATQAWPDDVAEGDLEGLHQWCDGNLSRLALVTGLSRTTLRRKLRRAGARE